MITVKVGPRGQITLPLVIRRAIGLHKGDRVLLVPKGDRIILRLLPQTLFDLRGSVLVQVEQDFSAIRQKVLASQTKKAVENEG